MLIYFGYQTVLKRNMDTLMTFDIHDNSLSGNPAQKIWKFSEKPSAIAIRSLRGCPGNCISQPNNDGGVVWRQVEKFN